MASTPPAVVSRHDTGTLAGSADQAIVDGSTQGGRAEVWHTGAIDRWKAARCPPSATGHRAELDWERRHQLMRTHTALHVLCGVIWNEWQVPVTGGNMEPLARDGLRVRPRARGVRRPHRGAGQRRARRRPPDRGVSFLPRDVAVHDADLIRTKVNMIPESVTEIRVVDIVGLDKQADGGTHVRSHRRGRPHPRGQDREQGQGQQARPPRDRRRLIARSGERTTYGRPFTNVS
jgi:misacylated tRNA(Ala) deacylase